MKATANWTLVVAIAGALAVVYAAASLIRSRKRRRDALAMQRALEERAAEDTAQAGLPAATIGGNAPLRMPPVPQTPLPQPKALLTWTPPPTDGPPRFRQYITWPDSKVTTPVVETPPSEGDYVWE